MLHPPVVGLCMCGFFLGWPRGCRSIGSVILYVLLLIYEAFISFSMALDR